MQVSLDGRIAGPNGEFDWPKVGDELLGYFNDQVRDASSFVYGRRMFQEMAEFWPAGDTNPMSTAQMVDYAGIWRPMPKIVLSDSLSAVDFNTRVVPRRNVADEISALRSQRGGAHVFYGGARAAATLMALDLIDEYWLFVHPVVLGAGPRLFDDLPHRITLELAESRTFPGDALHLRYRSAH
jgi:dihydrofolate reductase